MRARPGTVHRAAAAFFLTLAAGPAQAQPATWESWGGRVASQVAKFMPEPVAGLVDRHPWEAGQGPGRTWTSTKDHAQADEALARRMLERVDFAGLAKLLQP